MSEFMDNVITKAGMLILAKAQAGNPIVYTRIALGDQYPPVEVDNFEDMTDMPDAVISIDELSKKIENGNAVISGKLTIQHMDDKGIDSFYYRELGLFAKDPDTEEEVLYSYGNAGDLAELVVRSDTTLIERTVDIITGISNAASITVELSAPNYASLEDLEAKADKIDLEAKADKIDLEAKADKADFDELKETVDFLSLKVPNRTDFYKNESYIETKLTSASVKQINISNPKPGKNRRIIIQAVANGRIIFNGSSERNGAGVVELYLNSSLESKGLIGQRQGGTFAQNTVNDESFLAGSVSLATTLTSSSDVPVELKYGCIIGYAGNTTLGLDHWWIRVDQIFDIE